LTEKPSIIFGFHMAASQAVAAPGVVLDTNAVLDGWLFTDAAMQPLRQAIQAGRVVWLASARMRQELQHTLSKPELRARLAGSECPLVAFDAWARQCPEPPPPPAAWPRCTDATDQVFIDLADQPRPRRAQAGSARGGAGPVDWPAGAVAATAALRVLARVRSASSRAPCCPRTPG
jgi:predicted nucleic acid-binding protein